MAYTTINDPTDYFNTKLYTGNGTDNHAITGVNFQPDFIWIKPRNEARGHHLQDIIRGVNGALITNEASAEYTGLTNVIKSFDSDGFTLGTSNDVNKSANTHVSWNWLASNTTASNTQGDITSTVSANTTSGFSIVSYTGTGSNATVGHGLGVAPKMIIVKNRSVSGNWRVYHNSIGATKYLNLNTTASEATNSAQWNNTEPTSNVFSVGASSATNGSGNSMITYCFAEKKGFSKFGSYQGNSSTDGTFVYLGFKPAFVIIKNASDGNNWVLLDNKRNTFNVQNTALAPNTSGADDTNTSNYGTDFLSNGMKMRTSGSYTSNSNNATGDTYIYMAFAESPFTTSTGVPTTAR
jgi:hypothetical protein